MQKSSTRNHSLDLIRVVSMFFVICIHTTPWPFSSSGLVTAVLTIVFFLCNSCFYMLSGQLNLNKQFEQEGDFGRYYKKKAISILFPYVFVTIMMRLINMIYDGSLTSAGVFFKKLYISFMDTNYSIHLWYMYPLMGMLLSVPFLSKMLHALKDKEVHLLFVIGMIWKIISTYLVMNFGVTFNYRGWILADWVFTFFAGYYCYRMVNEKNEKTFYILGILGLVLSIFAQWKFPAQSVNTSSMAPAYIFFVMAVYLFASRHIHIREGVFQKILSFIAKYSFLVYLLHWYVNAYITSRFIHFSYNTINFVVSVLVTFVITMILSLILDTLIIRPIQKLLLKKV